MALYFIECQDFVKIGIAGNTDSRIRELQVGNPYPLRLLFETAGGRNEELTFHKQFRHLRQRGEWFRKSAEILDVLKWLKPLDRMYRSPFYSGNITIG